MRNSVHRLLLESLLQMTLYSFLGDFPWAIFVFDPSCIGWAPIGFNYLSIYEYLIISQTRGGVPTMQSVNDHRFKNFVRNLLAIVEMSLL